MKAMGLTSNFVDAWIGHIVQVVAAGKLHQRAQVGWQTQSGSSLVQGSQEAGEEEASRPESGPVLYKTQQDLFLEWTNNF